MHSVTGNWRNNDQEWEFTVSFLGGQVYYSAKVICCDTWLSQFTASYHPSDTISGLSKSLVQNEKAKALRRQTHHMKLSKLRRVRFRNNTVVAHLELWLHGKFETTPKCIAGALDQQFASLMASSKAKDRPRLQSRTKPRYLLYPLKLRILHADSLVLSQGIAYVLIAALSSCRYGGFDLHITLLKVLRT